MLNNKYLIINILFNASALFTGVIRFLHSSEAISSLKWYDRITPVKRFMVRDIRKKTVREAVGA